MIDINKLPSEADNPLNQIVKSPIKTIDYTIEQVASKIDSIDELNDDDIKSIISRQHEIFLNYELFISIPEKRRSLQKLFTNLRFLKIFNSIIGTLKLSKEEVIKFVKGETLNKKCPNGYHFVSYMGMNIGVVYAINDVLKNYYPKGLRFSADIDSSF